MSWKIRFEQVVGDFENFLLSKLRRMIFNKNNPIRKYLDAIAYDIGLHVNSSWSDEQLRQEIATHAINLLHSRLAKPSTHYIIVNPNDVNNDYTVSVDGE